MISCFVAVVFSAANIVSARLAPLTTNQAVEDRYLKGAHVVVGTPELISEAMSRGVPVIGPDCRAVIVDEADACFKVDAIKPILDAMREVDAKMQPRLVLAGATLSQDVIDMALKEKWISDESFVQVDVSAGSSVDVNSGGDIMDGASSDADDWVGGEKSTPSLISSRLQHRYVTTNDSDMLGMLCRTILADQKSHPVDSQPTRGIVYVKDSTVARRIVEPMRSVLWYVTHVFLCTPFRSSHPCSNLARLTGPDMTLACCSQMGASPSRTCTPFETTKQAC